MKISLSNKLNNYKNDINFKAITFELPVSMIGEIHWTFDLENL